MRVAKSGCDRRWALALLFASSGCIAKGTLQLPATDNAQTVLALFVPSTPKALPFAVASASGQTIGAVLRNGTEYEVYVLLYACPLALLGLEERTYALTTLDGRRSLPDGAFRVLASTVQDLAQTPWVDKTDDAGVEMTLAKLYLDIAPIGACGIEPVSTFEIDNTEGTQLQPLAVRIDDDSVLVGAEGAPFYKVGLDGHEKVPLPADTPALAGYRDPTGMIWLYGSDGRLVRGRIESGFEAIKDATTATGAKVAALVGPDKGDATELFLATDRPVFERYDRRVWSGMNVLLHDPVLSDPVSEAWASPGRAIAITSGYRVYDYEMGVGPRAFDVTGLLGECDPLATPCEYAWIVSYWMGRGALLATSSGRVALFSESLSTWTIIDGGPAARSNAISEVGGSLVSADVEGVIHVYRQGFDACLRSISGSIPTTIMPVDGALVIVSKNHRTPDPTKRLPSNIEIATLRNGSCLAH